MTQTRLAEASSQELTELYLNYAVKQDHALLHDEITNYNKIYRKIDAIEQELRSRSGDQRSVLMPFLSHRNAQVRYNAAGALLKIAPAQARQVLQSIIADKEFPQAGYAASLLGNLADGRFTPT